MKIDIPEEKRIFFVIAAAVLLITLVIFIVYFITGKKEVPDLQEAKIASVIDEYGIVIDSLTKKEYEIEKNETKGKLLEELGVPFEVARTIIEKTNDVITPRDYRVGLKYYAYTDKNKKLTNLVFQFGVFRYVMIDLKDSVRVIEKKEEIKTIRRVISSEIVGSLYGTLDSLGVASDPLADKMANNIYSSKIDFEHLQKGDSFKIVFDDIQVKGKSVDIGKIYAALFRHKNEDFYAFRFEHGGIEDYFDEKANSLREGFRKSPVKFVRISSRFSMNRLHPVLGYRRPHPGTDYAAPTGTPIMSIGNGVVIDKGYRGGFGNMVKIKHNSSYTTQYAHMSRFAAGIKKGSVVKKDQVIGYVGSTGLSSGPHVDFRFWKNGKLVDHTREKYPVSMPMDKKYRSSFFAIKDSLMKELNSSNTAQISKP